MNTQEPVENVSIRKRCPLCGAEKGMEVNKSALERWRSGTLIQDAFPDLSSDEREFLISGTCPKCWDELFPEEDEPPQPADPAKQYTGPEDPDIPF